MAANSITGFFLGRRGWQETQYIEASGLGDAEQIFFSDSYEEAGKSPSFQIQGKSMLASDGALI